MSHDLAIDLSFLYFLLSHSKTSDLENPFCLTAKCPYFEIVYEINFKLGGGFTFLILYKTKAERVMSRLFDQGLFYPFDFATHLS